jgi:hypothetical protein
MIDSLDNAMKIRSDDFFVWLSICAVVCVTSSCDILGHVRANEPEAGNFDTFLNRDLKLYFLKQQPQVTRIEYELLRQGATQAGMSYPKYHAWVRVYEGQKIIEEGAVRVAAVEKTDFDVTHFLSKEEIKKSPSLINSIFPAALCPDIISRASRP